MLDIFIDADGCPVKQEVYRVAKRYGLKVTLVSNSRMGTPQEDWLKVVVVDGQFNAADETISAPYDRPTAGSLVKQLDEERKAAVEQLKQAAYFHRWVAWLQDRFPKAELQFVPGLVKLVDRKEIEAADWILTPGRYNG